MNLRLTLYMDEVGQDSNLDVKRSSHNRMKSRRASWRTGAFYAQHVAPPVDHYAAAMAAYSLYNPSAAGGVGSVGNGGNMPLNNNMAGGFGSAANNRQLGAVPGSGSHTGQVSKSLNQTEIREQASWSVTQLN
jgi:hypothetical protein